GDTTYDSSYNKLSGTLVGVDWAKGKNGSGVKFSNPTNRCIELGDVPAYKVANKTISFWANPDYDQTIATRIFSAHTSANYYMGFATSRRMLISYYKAGTATQTAIYSSADAVISGSWHYYSY